MRKNRLRIVVLFLLVIALVIFYVVKVKIGNLASTRKIERPFSSLKIESAREINFEDNGQLIAVYKKDGQWRQKKEGLEFTASNDRINKIITSLINLVEDEIVSQNKSRHGEFGTDKNKISIKTADNIYTLYIGQATDADKNFVRVDGQNDVFTASGLIDVFAPFDYRDLMVNFVAYETKIHSFKITYNGNVVFFQKKKDKWLNKDNKQALNDRIDFFLNDLKTLKSSDILTQTPTLPLWPELTITINENGKNKIAAFYPAGDGKENYYLKNNLTHFIYQIPTVYVNSLKKEEKDFTD